MTFTLKSGFFVLAPKSNSGLFFVLVVVLVVVPVGRANKGAAAAGCGVVVLVLGRENKGLLLGKALSSSCWAAAVSPSEGDAKQISVGGGIAEPGELSTLISNRGIAMLSSRMREREGRKRSVVVACGKEKLCSRAVPRVASTSVVGCLSVDCEG